MIKPLAAKVRELKHRAKKRPLDHMRWLPGQMAILSDPSRFRLYRAGNQSMGKTTVGLAECIYEAEGEHPYREVTSSTEPVECWVLTASWAQSVAIQKKLWDLLDKDKVHPDTVFDPAKGFRGKNPAVQVRHRSGGWSIIRIKTTQQGALNLAGATIHFALFDEPPDSVRVYSEVKKRVQSTRGRVLLTLTPVNRDTRYLQDEVEEGKLVDHHFPLTPENMIPVGADRPMKLPDGTPCDAAWCQSIRDETLSYEAPVLVDGEWEFRAVGRAFEAFDATVHVYAPTKAMLDEDCIFLLGVDHGTDLVRADRPGAKTKDRMLGRQVAVLVALYQREGERHPRVYFLDCVRAEAQTTPDQDAAQIVEMLRRNGQQWSDLHEVWGDRIHMKGSASQKSNMDLAVALTKELGVRGGWQALRPPVKTAKRGAGRGAGSVQTGVRWLHHQMLRAGHFGVHPQAADLIEAIERWDRDELSIWKDPIDAARYALEPYIFGHRRTTSTRHVEVR